MILLCKKVWHFALNNTYQLCNFYNIWWRSVCIMLFNVIWSVTNTTNDTASTIRQIGRNSIVIDATMIIIGMLTVVLVILSILRELGLIGVELCRLQWLSSLVTMCARIYNVCCLWRNNNTKIEWDCYIMMQMDLRIKNTSIKPIVIRI